MPNGAVASELAKDGKKKTILRDLGNRYSLLKAKIDSLPGGSCHADVTDLSRAFLCKFGDFVSMLCPALPHAIVQIENVKFDLIVDSMSIARPLSSCGSERRQG
jgi:hypothetical protein